MRISRMEVLGGSRPPEKPSIKSCAPLGPAAGPARAFSSSCKSSGLSESMARSSALSTRAPTLLDGSRSMEIVSVTVISCLEDSMFNLALIEICFPLAISNLVCSKSENPVEETRIVYSPPGIPATLNLPSASAEETLINPPVPLTVMEAPGIAAPDGSVTTPLRTEVAGAWAKASAQVAARPRNKDSNRLWEVIVAPKARIFNL